MKQHYITSANFYTPGDTGEPDAYMADDDLQRMREIAGLSNILQPAISHTKNRTSPIVEKKILREVRFDSTK
jgi:hypothetical protein